VLLFLHIQSFCCSFGTASSVHCLVHFTELHTPGSHGRRATRNSQREGQHTCCTCRFSSSVCCNSFFARARSRPTLGDARPCVAPGNRALRRNLRAIDLHAQLVQSLSGTLLGFVALQRAVHHIVYHSLLRLAFPAQTSTQSHLREGSAKSSCHDAAPNGCMFCWDAEVGQAKPRETIFMRALHAGESDTEGRTIRSHLRLASLETAERCARI
jgi:hypothetical protein